MLSKFIKVDFGEYHTPLHFHPSQCEKRGKDVNKNVRTIH